MQDGEKKRESSAGDPDQLAKILELELMQQRAVWQRATASRSSLRTVSFLFLFVVIIAALIGIFYVVSVMQHPPARKNPEVSEPAKQAP